MDATPRNLSSLIVDALRVKSLTIEKLSQATGISERFIEQIIEEKFDDLPAAPYVRGYIVKIADTLGLNGGDLWKVYLKDNATLHRSGERDLLPHNRFATKPVNRGVVIMMLIAALFILYILIRLPSILGRPPLTLNIEEDELVVKASDFTLDGKSRLGDELTINGEAVYPDEQGNFSYLAKLTPGFNTFRVKSRGILGQEAIVTKQIFYESSTLEIKHGPTEEN
ncbi:helix-turn-helix domain-containing protein [Candidatus Jorgensenbacteria bacterium]|nr:helix-turn-helix domain-containing protein [Candidatus Jorgensenbacteria bacterium]